MFGNQLAMLSLLLVGLSLSGLSNLSEGVELTRRQLLRDLRLSIDFNEIYRLLLLIGGEYQIYADLANINEKNCTPERLLFKPSYMHTHLGQGLENYIAIMVERQRLLCEQSFVQRLIYQYYLYQDEWDGKEDFELFMEFVNPRPTLMASDMTNHIGKNIQSYINWRMTQDHIPEEDARTTLMKSCEFVNNLFGSFLASFRTGRSFMPTLDDELKGALVWAMIAEAVLND